MSRREGSLARLARIAVPGTTAGLYTSVSGIWLLALPSSAFLSALVTGREPVPLVGDMSGQMLAAGVTLLVGQAGVSAYNRKVQARIGGIAPLEPDLNLMPEAPLQPGPTS